jgi:hypothetical protein
MASKSTKRRSVRRVPKARAKRQASRAGAKRTIADVPSGTKLAALIAVLSTPQGATIAHMMALTGWQAHSIRGVMSGAIKKQQGLSIASKKVGDERIYRIASKR